MLFYDQNGALGQFQGFNNATHEYRVNNIASGGSINFMLGSASKFFVGTSGIGVGTSLPGASFDVAGSLRASGNITVSGASNGVIFPDNTKQTTATAVGPQGPAGPQGPVGPQGPPGPAVHTFAVCPNTPCSCTKLLSQSPGSCIVASDTGSCTNVHPGFCCVCAP